MATQPGTTLSKQYIIDRIGARKASLNRKISEADKLKEAAIIASIRPIRAWIDKNSDKPKAAVQALKAAQKEASPDGAINVDKLRKAANELDSALSSRDYLPHNNVPFDQRRIVEEGEKAQRELNLLEHAEIYLNDMPMTEFTLTGIGKLGLMDAIKFSLSSK